jgi:hypothetical protein
VVVNRLYNSGLEKEEKSNGRAALTDVAADKSLPPSFGGWKLCKPPRNAFVFYKRQDADAI